MYRLLLINVIYNKCTLEDIELKYDDGQFVFIP